VALSNLVPQGPQLELFERFQSLHSSVDEIRGRFGYDALRLASGR
jgi:hypothetical protein